MKIVFIQVSENFNVIVFSSIEKELGKKLLELIDPQNLIKISYFNEVNYIKYKI